MKFIVIAILVTVLFIALGLGPDVFTQVMMTTMSLIVFNLGAAHERAKHRVSPQEDVVR
jgi:multisubunit Na+/H+ antiporter MnhB subunit